MMASKPMNFQAPTLSLRSKAPMAAKPGSILGYAAGLLGVGLATLGAFLAEHLIAGPNLALVFVIPVLVTAINYGLGAAILSAVASVAVFDLLFITPRYTFAVASPSDLWAMALLAVVAAVASGLAARSRRRALDAEREARRADALRGLAHKVVEGVAPSAVASAAAETLGAIFEAPAVVLVDQDGRFPAQTLAGRSDRLSKADEEAARWALQNGLPTRAQAFPFDAAQFDFWPLGAPSGDQAVIGVEWREREKERAEAERYVDLVGAYLLAGLKLPKRTPAKGRSGL